MERTIDVIMLAGSIQSPPLRQQTGRAVASLPLSGRASGDASGSAVATLLEHWIEAVSALRGCRSVRVVVNCDEDVAHLGALVERSRRAPSAGRLSVSMDADRLPPSEVMLEPTSWRGTAGLLRDVAEEFDAASLILVIEANMLPPPTLLPLAEQFDEVVAGVLGATAQSEPIGVGLFRREVLDLIPRIGYFDLKEQLLPRLHAKGRRVRPATFDAPVLRLHDRQPYLRAVRIVAQRNALSGNFDAGEALRARFPHVRFEGACLVEDNVVIERGAIVHESVLLAGAQVEAGAVMSRCVVAPGANVGRESRHVRAIISPSPIGRSAAGEVPRRGPKKSAFQVLRRSARNAGIA